MEELVKTFHIDWKLMVAQLVNFAIVFFVLYKFAYGPILKVLNERTKKIDQGIKDAQEAGKKLTAIEEKEKETLTKAKKEAQKIISAGEESAKKSKDEVVIQAKNEAEKILAKAKEEIESEKKKMMLELKAEMANLVVVATEKIIKEKMTSEKDRILIENSIK